MVGQSFFIALQAAEFVHRFPQSGAIPEMLLVTFGRQMNMARPEPAPDKCRDNSFECDGMGAESAA